MNGRLVCCVFFATITASAQDEFPIKKEDIHALIREVAPKIEERFKGMNPEADGLLQRVEEALALPSPPPKNGRRPRATSRPAAHAGQRFSGLQMLHHRTPRRRV